MELRDLCAGISPHGGPIPARLTSVDPFQRSWDVLVESLKQIHSDLLSVVAGADDAGVLAARAPFVMVVKTSGDAGSEILEWAEALDWKAYAQAVRVHTHEHLAQVECTVTVVLNNDDGRP